MTSGVVRALQMQKPSTPRYKRGVERVAEIGEFQMASGVIGALQMQKPSTPRYKRGVGRVEKPQKARKGISFSYLIMILSPFCGIKVMKCLTLCYHDTLLRSFFIVAIG